MSTLAPPVILPADDRHIDAMMQVMHGSFEPAWGEAWTRLQLASALAMDGCFAACALAPDGAPVGFSLARAILDEAELLLVAVLPDARGTGVGSALVAGAIAESRRRGCSKMFLEVRENNRSARNLYHASGFFDIGRRSDYYFGAAGARLAAITMQRTIAD